MPTTEMMETTNRVYRKVFQTIEGQEVLADILNDCGFYSLEDVKDPSDIARMNVARRILGKMGVWEPLNLPQLTEIIADEREPRGFVKRILKLPIPSRRSKIHAED